MNHNIKFIHVVLCGLVLFFIAIPAIASAETANLIPTAVQTTVKPMQIPIQLPDLVVQEIYCAPGNKLSFNVANMLTPIPSGWIAVADVYFDGIKMGSIDLGRPTGGDITVGSANYLTAFNITRPVEVKIIVDPTNSIKETDEGNNAKVAKIACQAAAADTPATAPLSPESTQTTQTAQTTAVINRCGELENKLNILMERLRTAQDQGQDAQGIIKDILALKTELQTCQAKTPQETKVVTPGIKNPCDELAMIRDSIAQLERKIIVIKEAIAKGEMNETDLAPYMKEYNYLKERLEKMSFACQQGKPLEESPCARLSKLELIYNEMNDKLAGTTVDKSSPKLMESVASMAKEIESLKQRCRGEKLDTEKVDSLYDLEKAYRAKQKAIVEGASDKDMQGELAKVEAEKKKLLEEFAQRFSELDARQNTIIRKLQIKDGKIILDDLKTNAKKVKVNIKEKEIEIESKDGGTTINDGDTTAQGDIPIEYSDGVLISGNSGKEIKMMPGALMRDIEGKDYVKIDDEITWLPITIVFQATQLSPQPDPPGITLPAGTKAEKIGEGQYKFLLSDRQTVELRNYDRKTKTGDVTIFGKDGAATASGMKGTLTAASKPKKSTAKISPSGLKELILKDDGTKPEYIAKVDKKGKILWLIPTTITAEYRISAETGDVTGTSTPWWSAIAVIDPDPPT